MSKFNAGDLIVVAKMPCKSDEDCFAVGDVAVVLDGDNFVDFSSSNNSRVHGDGCWWISDEYLKAYTPVEDLPLWKSNHMYLNDEQQQVLRKLLHRVQWDKEYAEKIHFVDSHSIDEAFVWDFTEEGADFWLDVDEQCCNKEIQQNDQIVSHATEKVIEPFCAEPISCGKITVEGVSSALATQEGGSHYKKCGIQPVEYIQANNLDYFQGNVIKYTTRHKDKNGVEDIKKAIHYLQLILELQYGK